jgi:hypothetical protein
MNGWINEHDCKCHFIDCRTDRYQVTSSLNERDALVTPAPGGDNIHGYLLHVE